AAEEAPAQEPVAEAVEEAPAQEPVAEAARGAVEGAKVVGEEEAEDYTATPRVKPAIPGMDLEVDIVREGEDAFRDRPRYSEDEDYEEVTEGAESDEELPQVIAEASIDLAAGARYRATGKRKTAVARVTLK